MARYTDRKARPWHLCLLLVALLPMLYSQRAAAAADGALRTCLTRVQPLYPPMARQIHVQGLVDVEITIEPDGHVSAARVLAGHPMLARAACDAVLQWRFSTGTEPAKLIVHVDFKI